MKAIVHDSYGGPEVLELRDIGMPEIGDGDVLVRVRAAGLDPGVWHLMTGLPYLVRIMGYGLRAPKSRVRGPRPQPGRGRSALPRNCCVGSLVQPARAPYGTVADHADVSPDSRPSAKSVPEQSLLHSAAEQPRVY